MDQPPLAVCQRGLCLAAEPGSAGVHLELERRAAEDVLLRAAVDLDPADLDVGAVELLDLHAGAWAFQQTPSRANLVRLAAVLPNGGLGAGLEHEIRHLVGAGSCDLHTKTLQQSLGNWSAKLCQRLVADLGEMAVETAAGQ